MSSSGVACARTQSVASSVVCGAERIEPSRHVAYAGKASAAAASGTATRARASRGQRRAAALAANAAPHARYGRSGIAKRS
jgi:hypothetical protein